MYLAYNVKWLKSLKFKTMALYTAVSSSYKDKMTKELATFDSSEVHKLMDRTGTRLALLPGGFLVKKGYDDAGGRTLQVVRAAAHEHLFNRVALSGDLTLADVFLLVRACPFLGAVFRQDFVSELSAHVGRALPSMAQRVAARAVEPEYDPMGLEYLELYADWTQDSADNSFRFLNLSFHGVGFALREPYQVGDFSYPVGERVHWSITLEDPVKLLGLPVRVRSEFAITEGDFASELYGQVRQRAKLGEIRLGELLHAVFRELSFYGTPDEARGVLAEVTSLLQECRDDGLKKHASQSVHLGTVLGDDLDSTAADPRLDAVFSHIGDVPLALIRRALRGLPDGAMVGPSLKTFFGDKVALLPEYAEMSARQLRRQLLEREGLFTVGEFL